MYERSAWPAGRVGDPLGVGLSAKQMVFASGAQDLHERAWQNDDILVPSPISTGSRSFLGSLVAPGLVGRFALTVAPVMLGTGMPLFCELTTPTSLTLVSSMAFPGAVVAQIYRPA
jgi:dihydrofolate reductase